MKNIKGFFLSETIIVMCVVAVVLVGLFSLFTSVYTNYKETEKYNGTNTLNALVSVKRYYESKGDLKELLTNENPIIDLTNLNIYDSEIYTKIKEEFGLEKIYLVDVDSFFASNKINNYNTSLRKYLKTLQKSGEIVLVGIGENNSYGNIKLGESEVVCSYGGELVQGAEYRNGDYIYRYKQQYNGTSWVDTNEDKWYYTTVDETGDGNICVVVNDKEVEKPDVPDIIADKIGKCGLYQDEHGDYRYAGKSPCNYVTFNNETWRIVGIFDTEKTVGGEKQKRIKLVRDDSLGRYTWDSSASNVNYGYGINEWSQADLMTELNTDYLNTNLTSNPTWYNGENNEKTATFDKSKILNSESQDLIDNAVWYLGAFENGTHSVKQAYDAERGNVKGKGCTGGTYCNDNITRTLNWTGKVGLIYPSDFGYASSTCYNDSSKYIESNSTNGYDSTLCKDNNWLSNNFSNFSYWLLSPIVSSTVSSQVWYVHLDGYAYGNGGAYGNFAVHPSVYLKSNVEIVEGDGTESNPYKFAINEEEPYFTYNNCTYQEFTALKDGYYKVEAWGAQGGTENSTGGEGGYTSGYLYLSKNEKLYIYVGSQPTLTVNSCNGGGDTNNVHYPTNDGGGATDIRYFGTHTPTEEELAWNSELGLNSRIMVAGGGGGGIRLYSVLSDGGIAGGLFGGTGTWTGPELTGRIPTGGTPNSGGLHDNNVSGGLCGIQGAFGIGGDGNFSYGGGAGGAGYYGGGGGSNGRHVSSGGGGSSFISGYAGVNAITSATSRTHTNNTLHYSGKYFINGEMTAGVNKGHGKAKISFISSTKPERTTTKLNNVRYIKDCINGNNNNTHNAWVEIQAIKDGRNIAKGKTITGTVVSMDGRPYTIATDGIVSKDDYSDSKFDGLQCVTIDLGSTYNLDELAVWHYFNDSSRTYNNNITSVSSNNTNWTEVINKQEAETSQGKRVTAYENS